MAARTGSIGTGATTLADRTAAGEKIVAYVGTSRFTATDTNLDMTTAGDGGSHPSDGTSTDRFTFQVGDLSADPANSGKTDLITDFSHADGNRIDLTGFDADLSIPKRNAFSPFGTAAFTKRAGELRMESGGAYQTVSSDLDGVTDFTIKVSAGSTAFTRNAFLL